MRLRILQEANEALVGAAATAKAPPATAAAAASSAPLARAIQGAITSLQDMPVLKERNRDPAARTGATPRATSARSHFDAVIL